MVVWTVYGSQRLCVVAVLTVVVCVIVGMACVAGDTDSEKRREAFSVAAQEVARACAELPQMTSA